MADLKKWYTDTGSHGGIILATSVRIYRNFADIPFPARLTGEALRKINRTVRASLEHLRDFELYPVDMEALLPYEAVALAERHLISADFAASRENRLLLLREDESISVMVNERDHLRMQVLYGGLCTEKVFETANRLDDAFDGLFTYAFDEKLGFLTQNPADLGTAMRASVILHLPALSAQGVMMQFASTAPKLGLAVRNLYGEGGSAKGDLYQLTNTVTMGLSEQAAGCAAKPAAVDFVVNGIGIGSLHSGPVEAFHIVHPAACSGDGVNGRFANGVESSDPLFFQGFSAFNKGTVDRERPFSFIG